MLQLLKYLLCMMLLAFCKSISRFVCHVSLQYFGHALVNVNKVCGRTDVLDRISLCLPSFHSYGHKASCQVEDNQS